MPPGLTFSKCTRPSADVITLSKFQTQVSLYHKFQTCNESNKEKFRFLTARELSVYFFAGTLASPGTSFQYSQRPKPIFLRFFQPVSQEAIKSFHIECSHATAPSPTPPPPNTCTSPPTARLAFVVFCVGVLSGHS